MFPIAGQSQRINSPIAQTSLAVRTHQSLQRKEAQVVALLHSLCTLDRQKALLTVENLNFVTLRRDGPQQMILNYSGLYDDDESWRINAPAAQLEQLERLMAERAHIMSQPLEEPSRATPQRLSNSATPNVSRAPRALPNETVRTHNKDHIDSYLVELELCKRLAAGDGAQVLSEDVAYQRKLAAERFVHFMTMQNIDAQTQTPDQLTALKNNFLVTQPTANQTQLGGSSRATLDSKIQMYIEWRKTGSITVQQGVVIAITDRQKQVAQSNREHLTAYRQGIKVQKETPAGDGGMLISPAVAEERTVAASGFTYWLSVHERSILELTPPERQQLKDEYVGAVERKRKRPQTEETSTSHVLGNLLGKYLEWTHSGTVQTQRGVLTSKVPGSQTALQTNKAVLEAYRTALKKSEDKPTLAIGESVTKKTAQNRAGAASRLISALSTKGLNIAALTPQALSTEINALHSAIANKATAAKLKSDLGKFFEWHHRTAETGTAGTVQEYSEEQLAVLENNATHLADYREQLQAANQPAPGRTAALIGDNTRKHRAGTAAGFIEWLAGDHDAALLDEDELRLLKDDFLRTKYPPSADGTPHGTLSSADSNLNKYIDWRINGHIPPQQGGKVSVSAAQASPIGQANAQFLSVYRNALIDATKTMAGDGNFVLGTYVQQKRAQTARDFSVWLTEKNIALSPLITTRLASLVNEFLAHKYPEGSSKSTRDNTVGALNVFQEWCATKTVKPQRGVERIQDRETSMLLERNRYFLGLYQNDLKSKAAARQITPSMLKKFKNQAGDFTTRASLNGHDLSALDEQGLDIAIKEHVANKFPASQVTFKSDLQPYKQWLQARRQNEYAGRDTSPGLFVSENESDGE